MPADLEAIKAEWLNQCGPCDYGMPEYGCTHPSGDYRPVMLSLVEEIERLRLAVVYRATPKGWLCRNCGGKEDAHKMYCRHYVGPLEHRFTHTRWNDSLGGQEYDCCCGGSARVGGMAGSIPYGDEPVCPNLAEVWRGPVPESVKP